MNNKLLSTDYRNGFISTAYIFGFSVRFHAIYQHLTPTIALNKLYLFTEVDLEVFEKNRNIDNSVLMSTYKYRLLEGLQE